MSVNAGKIQIDLTFDRDDKLWNNWQHLCTTLFEHVKCSLDGQESVWLLLLTDTFEEDWEVVMIVKRHDINLPSKLVLGTVVDSNW